MNDTGGDSRPPGARLLRMVAYTPCAASNSQRLLDIATVIPNGEYHEDVGCYTVLHFDYNQGKFTNKSYGITFLLKRPRFPFTSWKTSIQGQVAAVTIPASGQAYLIVGLYFPPRANATEQSHEYPQTEMIGWLEHPLQNTPAKVTPFLLGDFNDTFANDPSDVIGDFPIVESAGLISLNITGISSVSEQGGTLQRSSSMSSSVSTAITSQGHRSVSMGK